MKTIRLITFKGCQSTVDLRAELERLIAVGGMDARVEMETVPAAEYAARAGLYGSPTVLVEGEEVQRERRGEPGFY